MSILMAFEADRQKDRDRAAERQRQIKEQTERQIQKKEQTESKRDKDSETETEAGTATDRQISLQIKTSTRSLHLIVLQRQIRSSKYNFSLLVCFKCAKK